MPKHLVISTSGNPDSNSRRMGQKAFAHLQEQKIDCDRIHQGASHSGAPHEVFNMSDTEPDPKKNQLPGLLFIRRIRLIRGHTWLVNV